MIAQVLFAALVSAGPKDLTLTVPESPYVKKLDPSECVRSTPVLDELGFKVGPKLLRADSGQHIVVYTEGGRQRFKISARVIPEFKYYSPVSGMRGKLDGNILHREASVAVRKSKGSKERVDGTFISDFEKLPDGKCKVSLDSSCEGAEGYKNAISIVLSSEFLEECTIKAEAEKQESPTHWLRPRRLAFYNNDETLSFALEFDPTEVSACVISRKSGLLSILRKTRRCTFVFDAGETFEPKVKPFLVGGIDFMAESGAHVAQYQSSPNILMNPSFESGDRYWFTQVDSDIHDFFKEGVAHSGKRCIELKRPGHNCLLSRGLVLKGNTDYVISAWIRPTGGKGGAMLRVSVRGAHKRDTMLKGLTLAKTKKDGEWERVYGKFRTLQDFSETTIWLSGDDLYVDDLQIEEGTEMTEYSGNPYGLELITDQPTAVYADSKKPQNLRLRVSGPAGAKGKLGILGKDFMDRRFFRKALAFNLGEGGEQIIPLAPDAELPLGTLVFTVKLIQTSQTPQTSQTISFTDYLRFTKIDARAGKDRLRNLQGTKMFARTKADVTRPAYHYERLRDFGIGALGYSGNKNGATLERLSKEDVDNLAKYGLSDRWGGVIWAANWKGYLNDKPWEWEGRGVRALTNYPPAMLAWVEKETYEMAKKVPWTDFYSIDSEPRGHWATLKQNNLAEYAKLMLAFNRGLMKANPENVFVPFGSCNMVPHSGCDYICEFLKTCKEIEPKTHFKQMEIHTYRQLPEHPSVDRDLTYFLGALDKIGYSDMKVKIGEGSYYYPFWRPSCNLFAWSHVSVKDAYSSVGIPTYDISWGERIGAALTLRESIVYFKHQDRVNVDCSWSPATVDTRSPIAWVTMNAALMSILGDATFVENFEFAKNCHAYVFDNQHGNTVALVWRAMVRYDHGYGKPVEMKMKNVGMELLDMMGNKVKVEGQGQRWKAISSNPTTNNQQPTTINLPLSGFPFYLRVPNAKRTAFLAALKGADVEKDETLAELLPPERREAAAYFSGAEPDWEKVPSVTDEGSVWQVAWNEREFRFRMKVKGVVTAKRRKIEKVHLRFDGFANAREVFADGERGHDYDDFIYQLRPAADGTSGECFRVRAPDHQLTGGAGYGFVKDVVEKDVKVTFTPAGKGEMLWEAAFPVHCLAPVKLAAGEKIGFAAEPESVEYYQNKPHLYLTLEFKK